MIAPRVRFSSFLALLLVAPAWGQYPWLNSTEPVSGNPAWPQSFQAPATDYFGASSPLEAVNSGPSDENYNMTVTLDAIILGRSGLKTQVLGIDEFGNPALSTEDISSGAQAGPRFSIMMGGRQTGLEFSFFGLNAFEYHDTIGEDGIIPVFFNGIPADPTESYDVYYRSRLYSAELMFWKPVFGACRFGVGIRGVGLNEDFNFQREDGENLAGFFCDANTDLVGLQFGGGLPLLRRPHFYIDATAKTGIYHHRSTMFVVTENYQHRADDIDSTAVTELNIGGEYHVGNHVSFRGGYLALWLHDVALGPNQNSSFDIVNGTGDFTNATALFQGGYFGFQVRW